MPSNLVFEAEHLILDISLRKSGWCSSKPVSYLSFSLVFSLPVLSESISADVLCWPVLRWLVMCWPVLRWLVLCWLVLQHQYIEAFPSPTNVSMQNTRPHPHFLRTFPASQKLVTPEYYASKYYVGTQWADSCGRSAAKSPLAPAPAQSLVREGTTRFQVYWQYVSVSWDCRSVVSAASSSIWL